MNAEPAPLFVPHRLLELTGGDSQLFGDMVAEFQKTLARYADDLAVAKTRAKWKEVSHRLKGAAQAVGAESIAQIAVLAELSAPGDATLLHKLEEEIERFSQI